MNTFVEILDKYENLPVAEQQAQARRELPQLLANSHLHRWSPEDRIRSQGMRLLIGIAPYSREDLKLLDFLEGVARQHSMHSLHIDVFDILECCSIEELGRYIPGVARVFQTPVVGFWIDGQLKDSASGRHGRDILWRCLDLETSPSNVEMQNPFDFSSSKPQITNS